MHIFAPRKWGVVFGTEMAADKLRDCAEKFNNLIDWEYEFIIGRKCVSSVFTVDFNADDFHHLIGLHKLRDNEFVRTTKRSRIFQSILVGKLTEANIKASQYYSLVRERMEAFSDIVNILETDPKVFKYSINRAGAFSKIDADYLVYHVGNERIYLFLKKRTTTDRYACISLFFERKTDYTLGQARYTLLKLTKKNRKTGSVSVIYKNPAYKEQNDKD